MKTFTLVSIIIGILLMVLEIVLPGAISLCLGISAILTGILYQFNIITEPFNVFLVWTGLSVVSSTIGILIVNKLFAGDTSVNEYDENADTLGKKVKVTENTSLDKGRIQFQGAGWNAISTGEVLETGATAYIVGKLDSKWIVESEKNYLSKFQP